MIRGFRTFAVVVFLVIGFLSVSSFGQTRPAPGGASDFKVKYRVTMNAGGQPHVTESVTMIKGARERSESQMGGGFDMVNITQCDLKRTIQINDKVRKYLITPMEVDTSASTATPSAPSAPAPSTPSRTGGTVTYITSSIDTGERREMFGLTALHVKSSLTIQ